jgi:hypothetical protein
MESRWFPPILQAMQQHGAPPKKAPEKAERSLRELDAVEPGRLALEDKALTVPPIRSSF